MNEYKKIVYNCRKATSLIEKKQLGRITIREKIELRIHLAGCSVCRTFEQQSILINRLVKDLFNFSRQEDVTLDDAFKKNLQRKIEDQLSRN